jgi:hypothetical protein
MRVFYDIQIRDINKLLIGLLVFEIFLVIIHITSLLVFGRVSPFFHLDVEANLPSWFSSTQYLLIGIIFLVRSQQSTSVPYPSHRFFILLFFGFMLLSMDEAAQFHETLNGFLLKKFDWAPSFKGGNGVWIFIYGLIGVVLLHKTFRDILGLWNHNRRQTTIMTLGLAMLAFGSVGLEIFSYEFLKNGATPLLDVIEPAVEEFFEMFGVSVILYGALLLLIDKTDT